MPAVALRRSEGWIARCLERMDGAAPDSVAPRLRAFQTIVAMVIATEYLAKGIRDRASMTPLDGFAVAAAVALAAVVLSGRRRREAFAGFALLQLIWIVQYFPLAGNHRYLELTLATLFATLDVRNKDERTLLLQSARWITVVVLFASGFQKLVHGYWFRGQFLAWSMWRESFATAFAPLLTAEETVRLTTSAADGPYLLSSPWLLGLSNAVWAGELLLAVLLVPRATRAFAWVAAVGLLCAAEVAARELMFGIEFAAALMLFARTDVLRRLVVPLAVVLGLLLAVRLGWLPQVVFH